MRPRPLEQLRERLTALGMVVHDIFPARGFWTHKEQDVLCWVATVTLPGQAHQAQIGSWYTVTRCARSGIDPALTTPADRSCSGYLEVVPNGKA